LISSKKKLNVLNQNVEFTVSKKLKSIINYIQFFLKKISELNYRTNSIILL